jgi:hypothetical protein
MKHLFLALAPLLLLACSSCAQHSTNNKSPAFTKTIIPLRDGTEIYVNDGDSDRLFYYALVPNGTIKGALVLFPPNGEVVEASISANSALAAAARENGLLMIVPSVNHNVYLDKTTLNAINTMLNDVLKKYRAPKNKFVLGGFSLGGMNAIRYTELAYEDSNATALRPVAVYGIDPPLDLTRLYRSFQKAVEKNFSEPAVHEANYFIGRLNTEFAGSPDAHPDIYVQRSMYSDGIPQGGNARFLHKIPVRIYSDPDIEWQLKNRRVDYYDMNALDGAAMINVLLQNDNDRAEFVNALGKGIRPNGARHPHSWSLADPKECVQWILHCL